MLGKTDPIRANASKKEDAPPISEVRNATSESLLMWIAEKGVNVSRDAGRSLVIMKVMLTEGVKF